MLQSPQLRADSKQSLSAGSLTEQQEHHHRQCQRVSCMARCPPLGYPADYQGQIWICLNGWGSGRWLGIKEMTGKIGQLQLWLRRAFVKMLCPRYAPVMSLPDIKISVHCISCSCDQAVSPKQYLPKSERLLWLKAWSPERYPKAFTVTLVSDSQLSQLGAILRSASPANMQQTSVNG